MANLLFFNGEIGSGKTTWAYFLAEKLELKIYSVDAMIFELQLKFSDGASFVNAYLKARQKIEQITSLSLRQNENVVLDFGGNSLEERSWAKQLALSCHSSHLLFILNTPKEISEKRVDQRQSSQSGWGSISQQEFEKQVPGARRTLPKPHENLNTLQIAHGQSPDHLIDLIRPRLVPSEPLLPATH